MIEISLDADDWTAITAGVTFSDIALGKVKASLATGTQIQAYALISPVLDFTSINHIHLKLDCSGDAAGGWDYMIYFGVGSSPSIANNLVYDDPSGVKQQTAGTELTLDIDIKHMYETGTIDRSAISWIAIETNMAADTNVYWTVRDIWVDNLYCRPIDVAREFLKDNATVTDFDATNVPYITDIIEVILDMMAEIDVVCSQSWRPNLMLEKYFHTDGTRQTDLRQRPIISVANLYYWNGAEYTSETVQRAKSNSIAWVDTNGWLHWMSNVPLEHEDGCYIDIIYGHKTIPRDIKDAAAKKTVAWLYINNPRWLGFAMGAKMDMAIPLNKEAQARELLLKHVRDIR